MSSLSLYFVAILSIISATNAFLPTTTCTSHIKSKTSSTTTTHQMSFMADSSDYKQSNSDFGEGDKTATSEAPLRGEVDMVRIIFILATLCFFFLC